MAVVSDKVIKRWQQFYANKSVELYNRAMKSHAKYTKGKSIFLSVYGKKPNCLSTVIAYNYESDFLFDLIEDYYYFKYNKPFTPLTKRMTAYFNSAIDVEIVNAVKNKQASINTYHYSVKWLIEILG